MAAARLFSDEEIERLQRELEVNRPRPTNEEESIAEEERLIEDLKNKYYGKPGPERERREKFLDEKDKLRMTFYKEVAAVSSKIYEEECLVRIKFEDELAKLIELHQQTPTRENRSILL